MRLKYAVMQQIFARRLPSHMSAVVDQLGQESVVVDCGAHVGFASVLFAKTGASVWSFEPNPHAYQVLKRRTRKFPQVCTFEAAVTDGSSSHSKLFMHSQHHEDPVAFASGSSLRSDKPNVSSASVDVNAVDLAAFLLEIGPVQILKIDIEGYEVALIPHLVERNALQNVENVWVELHDRKWPSLSRETLEMRALCADVPTTRFSWDWP